MHLVSVTLYPRDSYMFNSNATSGIKYSPSTLQTLIIKNMFYKYLNMSDLVPSIVHTLTTQSQNISKSLNP